MLTFYNTLYTSLPSLLYGVFEKDCEPDELLAYAIAARCPSLRRSPVVR